MSRIIDTKVIPGEPTDGSGKVCIHLLVPDPRGAVVEPHALHPVIKDGQVVKGEVDAGPKRFRVACNSRVADVQPRVNGNVVSLFHRTDDPRAVSCPKCKASKDYENMIGALNKL